MRKDDFLNDRFDSSDRFSQNGSDRFGNSRPGIFDEGRSGKSRGVAGLLALLVGGLGVHYFYCGKTAGGIICLILTFCTCGLFDVIVLIQGILFFFMSQEEFEGKWVYSQTSMPFF